MVLTSPQVDDSSIYECGYEYGPNSKYGAIMATDVIVLSMADSHSCLFYKLPVLDSNPDSESEIVCTWSHTQTASSHFEKSGETIEADLQYSDRIISRRNSADVTDDIDCVVVTQNNERISTPCTADNATNEEGVVRVDPFLSEIANGSDASFTCMVGNQDYQSGISWHVTYDDGVEVGQERLNADQNVVTILNVQEGDESILVECRVPVENTQVSSFAALSVVEATVSPSRRPPGESQSNTTTVSTTPQQDGGFITQSTSPPEQKTVVIIAAIIIVVIIVILIIIIIILVLRRRHKSSEDKKQSRKENTELRDIPHETHNGSSQLYALSFKDKRVRKHHSADVADDKSKQQSLSSSCGILNVQPSSSGERIYAEPDIGETVSSQKAGLTGFKPPVVKSASLPLLDVSEYETISYECDDKRKANTLSALSVTSLSGSRSERRWTSQRFKKGTPETPPRARHAFSFRRPTVKNPNVSSEYTDMVVNRKSDPIEHVDSPPRISVTYAKPDKKKTGQKKTSPRKEEKENTGQTADNSNHEYADISKVVSKDEVIDNEELIDTYLTSLPGPFCSPMVGSSEGKNKAASLHRMASRSAPPMKPQRGKCQSEFLGNAAYSMISDYEIMSEQIKESDEGNYDYDDLDNDDEFRPTSAYDQPRPVSRGQSLHSLTLMDECAKAPEVEGNYSEQNEYETITTQGNNHDISTTVPQSPGYADIAEMSYSSIDDFGSNS